ncbi:hypothetical protein QJ041_06200 [Olsenella sp. YH-ols2216]|nr:hypothetical protein [Olsenella sp. YH-ols2216]
MLKNAVPRNLAVTRRVGVYRRWENVDNQMRGVDMSQATVVREKTAVVSGRVEESRKHRVDMVFEGAGTSGSEQIRLMYEYVDRTGEVPNYEELADQARRAAAAREVLALTEGWYAPELVDKDAKELQVERAASYV